MPVSDQRPFTVAQITQLIKEGLEQRFPFITVEGELSNVRPSSTGHLYFTMKDEQAALSGVMFRGRTTNLAFAPEDGQLVIAQGGISVYPTRGTYQLIVERMQLAGVGRILAVLDERKNRLAAEGLFDESRKRPLPLLPERIAIVTSPTGAALRDILQVLGRRNAGVHVIVCPTPVQGDGAASRIALMIRAASMHRLGDVIIVSRGGGSIEDLLPFSDEEVVRAIAESEVPVISAVGHQTDWALSDYVADLRAPTPSAAAEVVASSREELLGRVVDLGRSIVSVFLERFRRARLLMRQFSPQELRRAYLLLVQPTLQDFDRAREELVLAITGRLTTARHALELAQRELESCSPYEILSRGYAIARLSDKIITDSNQVNAGDLLNIQLHHGSVDALAEETHPDEEL